MGLRCYLCGNKSDRTKRISLHVFPPRTSRNFKQWLAVCELTENDVVDNLRICTIHFEVNNLMFCNTRSILKQGAVPKIKVPNVKALLSSQSNEPDPRPLLSPSLDRERMSSWDLRYPVVKQETCDEIIIIEDELSIKQEEDEGQVEFQEYIPETVSNSESVHEKIREETYIPKSPTLDCHQITGFTDSQLSKINALLNLNSLKRIVYEDYILITLAMYKQKLSFETASEMFKIDVDTIQNIFEVTTDNVYDRLKEYNFWQHRLRKPLRYHAIFNSVEVPVSISNRPQLNQLLTSLSLSNRTTFKYLVVTDERGFITFCSNVYGGSTSGRKIVMDSEIMEMILPESCILTDKEFIISDLCAEKNIGMDVALFVNYGMDCDIGRAYRHLTEFDILKKPMEESLWSLANKIVYNCMLLINFKKDFWKNAMVSFLTSHKTLNINSSSES